VVAIYGRLEGLYDHMMTITDLSTKFKPISGRDKPRIYFHADNSYLFYNEYGKLWAGLQPSTPRERQNCEAQQAIDTYGLDKEVFKPTTGIEEPLESGQSVASPTLVALCASQVLSRPGRSGIDFSP
jgi:hypothetical protein